MAAVSPMLHKLVMSNMMEMQRQRQLRQQHALAQSQSQAPAAAAAPAAHSPQASFHTCSSTGAMGEEEEGEESMVVTSRPYKRPCCSP